MLLLIGLAALLPLVGVITVSTLSAYRIVLADGDRYATSFGELAASRIEASFESRAGALRAMAAAFSAFSVIPVDRRRSVIAQELYSVLKADPDVLSAWAMWEPGAMGDNPSAFKGSPLTTPGGRFNVTWYRDSTGAVVSGTINDADFEGAYYTLPKAGGRLTLLEPYSYSYTGRPEDRILETSLCMPVYVEAVFQGVVGFDFSIGLIQRQIEGFRPFGSGYATLVSSKGTRIAHPLREKLGTTSGDDMSPQDQATHLARIARGKAFSLEKFALLGGAWSRQFFFPIEIKGIDKPWYLALVIPVAAIKAPARDLGLLLGSLGLVALLTVALAIFFVARSLSRPIAALAKGAEAIAGGDLSVRVYVSGEDEIGQLSTSFNTMADRLGATLRGYDEANLSIAERNRELAQAQESLTALNAELEDRVRERTASLEQAQEELEISAKFAVLGRLFANIAHELNTPLGAISSSANFLREGLEAAAASFLPDFEALSPAGRVFFHDLLPLGMALARQLDHPEDRKARRALAAAIDSAGLGSPESLADAVSSLGALDRQAEVIQRALAGDRVAIDLAAQLCGLARSVTIVLEASAKASATVAALGNYSRFGDLGAAELVHPVAELETLLTLYYNKLKRSVKVECRFLSTSP